jgi:hypothetical protein
MSKKNAKTVPAPKLDAAGKKAPRKVKAVPPFASEVLPAGPVETSKTFHTTCEACRNALVEQTIGIAPTEPVRCPACIQADRPGYTARKITATESVDQKHARMDAEVIKSTARIESVIGPIAKSSNSKSNAAPVVNEVNAPAKMSTGKKGSHRYELYGQPITAILRWMGKNEWKYEDARNTLNKLGFTEVADPTLRAQLYGGKTGTRGEVPALDANQVETLNGLAGKTPKPVAPKAAKKGKKASK